METSTKFSNTELVFVIVNSVISKLFLVYPSAFATLGASASIILAVLTSVAGLIFTIITARLYNGKSDITQLIEKKPVKIIFTILVILLFTGSQGYFVRSVTESLRISILPQSPMFFISSIYIAGVLICSHTGLKAIIRAHSFVTPFTIILVLLLFISSISNLLLLSAYFADFILLMLIMPFASEKASCKKVIVPTYIISSAMLVLIIGIYTLTIPYNSTNTFFITVYRIAQYINYESFMARMESIFTIGWMLSYFLTSATYLYVTSMLTGRLFKARNYRPYMYVISAIIFGISFIPQNTNRLVEQSNLFAAPRLVIAMILPIVILIAAKHREGKDR